MYKILLDDDFYRGSKKTNEYLEKLLNIIKVYFNAEVALFEPFYSSKETYHITTMSKLVNKKILKTYKVKKYDLNKVTISNNLSQHELPFSSSFIDKIDYILSDDSENKVIVPLVYDIQNRKLIVKNYADKIFIVGNYDEEIDSNISKWIKNNELINISQPSISDKFPAHDLCGGFNDWRSNILQPQYEGDKISDLSAIGLEVATRNKYIYDAKLTELNKRKARPDKKGYHPKRQVFINNEHDVYLSTDFENGGFEVYDKNTKHQGQFRFNGEFEKDADTHSHPLYLK